MKKQLTNQQGNCDGTWLGDPAHFRRPSRRDFLYVGMIGGLGLTLGDFFKMQSTARAASAGTSVGGDVAKVATAKSVIHIYLPGGMAAQESWDPKPFAPLEYRGPLGTVKTKIDGEFFGENMKHTADILKKEDGEYVNEAYGKSPATIHLTVQGGIGAIHLIEER